MCPECGGVSTRVINASHDPEGNRIRRRECGACGHTFPTVEVAFPFSFHEADADKREAPAYSSRIKVPEYEPSYFVAERGRLHVRRDPLAIKHRTGRAFVSDPEGDVILVRLKRSNKYPRCRKGIHVMRGKNVYHHPRGHKVCNACRREAANAYYRHRMDNMPATLRAEWAEKERARLSRRRAARREVAA